MNRVFLLIGIVLLPFTLTWAQKITFASQEMEAGLRYRLGLSETTPITKELLENITEIDLSCMEITNISDIVYMPNLKVLDLHENEIDNIAPLLALDSLRQVDLSHNKLTSIFALSFSRSSKMSVKVAFNYISDFSIFTTLTPCQFTIEGIGLQTLKDAPYFMVCYMYCDGTSTEPFVSCRLEATTTDKAELTIGEASFSVETDGLPHRCQLDGNLKETCQVRVTDGTTADSTYLVPCCAVHVDPSQKVTIESGLPGDYEILYPMTQQGLLCNDSVNLVYTANVDFNYEEVIYTYYRGGVFKGISKLYLTKDEVTDGIDMKESPKARWDLSYDGKMLNVKCFSEALVNESFIEVCDITGIVLATRHVGGRNAIYEHITLGHLANTVIIVRVKSGKSIFMEKLLIP